MKKMREAIKASISPAYKLEMDTLDFVAGLNRKIVKMRNYYLIPNLAQRWLTKVDWYIRERFVIHYNARRKQPKRGNRKVVIELLLFVIC